MARSDLLISLVKASAAGDIASSRSTAEAIAADVGLGYRIFLVRRYLSMDVILPYVVWITLLAYIFDLLLVWVGRKAFPWAYVAETR